MASFLASVRSFFGGAASAETIGLQIMGPGTPLVKNSKAIGEDAALQIGAVWACLDRRATTIASLPCFVYRNSPNGERDIAKTERLYQLLHNSPNSRMTPFNFWRALVYNHDLRGAGYARIERNAAGEAVALWPMPTSQVTPIVLDDGSMVYEYRLGTSVAVLSESNVMAVRGLGNGTTGMDKLAFMRGTLSEAAAAQDQAARISENGGKPSGLLMIDGILNPQQREQIKQTFAGLAAGNASDLHVMEARMDFKQLAMSPADQELLETRRFTVEDICSWLDVPPVLIHRGGATTWGSGIYEIKDGFHTLAMMPLTVNIEQAIRKDVMTPRERATLTVEFSYDSLLRGDPDKRSQIYARYVQNGIKTRRQIRRLENDPPINGDDVLTVQANLLPIDMLGKIKPASGGAGESIAQ